MIPFNLCAIFFNIRKKHFPSFFVNVFFVYIPRLWERGNMLLKFRVTVNQAKHTSCFASHEVQILQNGNCFFGRFLLITMYCSISTFPDEMKCIHDVPIMNKFTNDGVAQNVCKTQKSYLLIMCSQINKLSQ